MIRLIILGPPGAGKGTLSKIICRDHDIPQISTGDLFRMNISQKTELGLKASAFVEKGELVPDTLVIEMTKKRLEEEDAKKGFVLDGFPRTEAQAKALDDLLQELLWPILL